MIVVFDTNIWKADLYLRSPAAAAVKLFLHMHAAKVGLPEVIRLEVERHLRQDYGPFEIELVRTTSVFSDCLADCAKLSYRQMMKSTQSSQASSPNLASTFWMCRSLRNPLETPSLEQSTRSHRATSHSNLRMASYGTIASN